MTEWSFIIVAAGKGSRFGGVGKQFSDLGGRPLWQWPVLTALSLRSSGVTEVILVVPKDASDRFDIESLPPGVNIRLVEGGETRAGSVLSGLRKASRPWVLIHDAVRPFVSRELCVKLMNEAIVKGAAIPLIHFSDALKVMEGDSVSRSQNRSNLKRTQTPQAFPARAIKETLESTDGDYPDEAEAWLSTGRELSWVHGENRNFKITYPEDLEFAKMLISETIETRSGIGYDIHTLCPGRPFVIGGVIIPFSLGISGHSDGDLLCHAITDAILGAAGLPDIGSVFPSTDNKYKNARSLSLLAEVVNNIRDRGFVVRSVDAVITAQVPELAPWIAKIEESLKKVIFGCYEGSLTVKAKSGERIGAVGNGEAIACWALASIRSSGLLTGAI